MAVRYLDNEHKETSGYIVSGAEARKVKKHLFEKTKDVKLQSIKETSASLKHLIKFFSA